jgi:F1F0 ATPase subunit 2
MDVHVTLLALAFLWGAFLGLFHFGGLWLTVKTAPGKRRPVRWLAGSFVIRLAAVLAGFGWSLRLNPTAFFCTLSGFFLLRIVLTRILGHEKWRPRHANYA